MRKKLLNALINTYGLFEAKANAKWTSKTIENSSELSKKLIHYMELGGWQSGWPYCMAFVKAAYLEAYEDDAEKTRIIKKMLTPSVMVSFKNCKNYVPKPAVPKPGTIFLMQNGRGSTGHAGIVGEIIKKDSFSTLEGNTSPSPATAEADRNGDGIYAKTRKLNFAASDGLHLIGFIDLFQL